MRAGNGPARFRLDSAPEGMTLDAAGVLTWKVPPRHREDFASVIITVSDAKGHETPHAFRLDVIGP